MRKIFFFALVLVFPLSVFPQQTITGYIHDAVTTKPVAGANIQIDQRAITRSDQNGMFKVRSMIPLTFTVSHINYFTKELVISKLPADSLIIELIPNIRDLHEVEVSAKPYSLYFNPRTFYIQDFAIEKNRIWAIGFANKNILKPELRLLNLSGKTLDKMLIKPNSGLFQDPSGCVHLFNHDSVFQLFFNNGVISFIYRNAMDESWDILSNLQVIREDTLIFRSFNQSRVYCEFIAGNVTDGRYDTIFTSYNRSRFNSALAAKNYSHGPIVGSGIFASPVNKAQGFPSMLRHDNPENAGKSDKDILAAESNKVTTRSGDTGLAATLASRGRAADYAYKRNVLNKPVQAQLFYTTGFYHVFEATNRQLWRLNPDYTVLGSLDITIDPDAIDIRMLQDPVDQLLYLSYKVFGTCFLSQLNPDNGYITKTIKLTGFPFAEKVKIYNGSIYFIYQTSSGHSYTNLYSMEFN